MDSAVRSGGGHGETRVMQRIPAVDGGRRDKITLGKINDGVVGAGGRRVDKIGRARGAAGGGGRRGDGRRRCRARCRGLKRACSESGGDGGMDDAADVGADKSGRSGGNEAGVGGANGGSGGGGMASGRVLRRGAAQRGGRCCAQCGDVVGLRGGGCWSLQWWGGLWRGEDAAQARQK